MSVVGLQILTLLDINTVNCVRFHLVGLLILTLLDIGDVSLELSKSVFYFKDRGGKKTNRGAEILANMCFAVFALQQ